MDGSTSGTRLIDAYIASFPHDVQAKLNELRATIRAAAPDAVEKIAYQMPAFAQHGNLVYFAARAHHIGLYPTGSGVEAFQAELSGYTCSRGAIQFPLDQPLPLELISRIVRYRVAANQADAASKSAKRAARSSEQREQ